MLFHNCAVFNQWTEEKRLDFLRCPLDGDAAQVLWDYSNAEVDTIAKLNTKLQQPIQRLHAARQMQS